MHGNSAITNDLDKGINHYGIPQKAMQHEKREVAMTTFRTSRRVRPISSTTQSKIMDSSVYASVELVQ